MKLIIGGHAQGKLEYVLEEGKKQGKGENSFYILEGAMLKGEQLEEAALRIVVINHFHMWVRNSMMQGENPGESILKLVSRIPECIIISDEVGNGIVPADAFERAYREETGRILTKLAGEAEEVVRVICGIGQKIK